MCFPRCMNCVSAVTMFKLYSVLQLEFLHKDQLRAYSWLCLRICLGIALPICSLLFSLESRRHTGGSNLLQWASKIQFQWEGGRFLAKKSHIKALSSIPLPKRILVPLLLLCDDLLLQQGEFSVCLLTVSRRLLANYIAIFLLECIPLKSVFLSPAPTSLGGSYSVQLFFHSAFLLDWQYLHNIFGGKELLKYSFCFNDRTAYAVTPPSIF